VTQSVGAILDMAKALSEGEFEQQFQQHFQGELGELASYLEAVRQTLQSLSNSANGSKELIPKAADGVAEINREAESGFNSVWEVVEQMQSDQAAVRQLLDAGAGSLSKEEVAHLRGIAEKGQQSLLALMSYLSFQDVLRQRLEKVQQIIGKLEEKTLDLIVKSNGKASENAGADNAAAKQSKDAPLDQGLVDQLMAQLR
jgi:chemotaxis regulatin CheY-phosphate phosphatase CheZ